MKKGIVVLGLAALAWIAAACGGEEPAALPEAGAQPVAVETAEARLASVDQVTRATGSVEPWRRTSPGTKILGRVQEVPVREGDRVEKDGLLARLESRDLEAAMEGARAAIAMAEASLENADAQHRRMEELHRRGSATDKNLEDARAAHRSAEAALQRARAELTAARVTLEYAAILSPIGGRVVARNVEVGDMALPGQPMFTVEDLSRAKIVVQVPESQVADLGRGDPAWIEVDVLGREFPARVDRVMPAGDPRSRTFDVKLVVDNPERLLKSGMFVRARFPRGSRDVLRVPETSIVTRGQLRGLFVIAADGAARLRWVQPGRAEAGQVEILSGLAPGERYVVSPPAGFADATLVATR
jgi:RND family efflux transporter MFP subunit